MACLSIARQARIQAQIDAKEAQLTEAYAATLAAIPNAETSEYEFDSGEGRQMAKRRAPKQLLDMIDRLEKEIEHLYQKLEGTGLVSVKVRR